MLLMLSRLAIMIAPPHHLPALINTFPLWGGKKKICWDFLMLFLRTLLHIFAAHQVLKCAVVEFFWNLFTPVSFNATDPVCKVSRSFQCLVKVAKKGCKKSKNYRLSVSNPVHVCTFCNKKKRKEITKRYADISKGEPQFCVFTISISTVLGWQRLKSWCRTQLSILKCDLRAALAA